MDAKNLVKLRTLMGEVKNIPHENMIVFSEIKYHVMNDACVVKKVYLQYSLIGSIKNRFDKSVK